MVAFLFSCTGDTYLFRANKFYEQGKYADAALCFERKLQKQNDEDARIKLGYSYYKLKNYKKAEEHYSQCKSWSIYEPINLFYYAESLKNIGKADSAEKYYKLYIEKIPKDKTAELRIKSIEELPMILNQPVGFKPKTIIGLNTKRSEYCAQPYENGVLYVSESNTDLVNYSKNLYDNSYFSSFHFSPIAKSGDTIVFENSSLFSGKLNTILNEGPFSFTPDKQTIYYTAVFDKFKKPGQVNKAKLVYRALASGKWGPVQYFKYNNDTFSVAHPSISADGQLLYFVSDMPGGFGGKDIYVCKKEGADWGAPQNMGETINTIGNELFPYIRKDNVLFFASDGHSGLGGLDLFSVLQYKGKWTMPYNLGRPVNSGADDFAISFTDDAKTAYISSNRQDSIRKADDIYAFAVAREFVRLSGKILASRSNDNPVGMVKVYLMKEDGTVIAVTRTLKDGSFIFSNIPADEKFMVYLDEEDASQLVNNSYYLTDENGRIVGVTVVKAGKKFVFRNLPPDLTTLPLLPEDDETTFAATILYGENPSLPLANKIIKIYNSKGEVIQTIVTNALGSFVFFNLPPDNDFMISIEEDDPALAMKKIILTNKDGKVIKVFQANSKGRFKFHFLPEDKILMKSMKVEDTELEINFTGYLKGNDSIPLADKKVSLVNSKGDVVQTTITNKRGKYKFTKLPFDDEYMVVIEEEDVVLEPYKRIFITNENGQIIRELVKKKKGKYHYKILPAEQEKMMEIYVDDPWLEVLKLEADKTNGKSASAGSEMLIIENVYYALDDWAITDDAKPILDKVVNVMVSNTNFKIEVSSHTDSRASDDYNLKLSEKRAKSAVDYIVQRGIPVSRIIGNGLGETKLINKCANGIECTEEEHAKNRRTEFKIIGK